MKTRPQPTRTLNETLLLQLERLGNPSLTGKALEEERERSRTMVELAQTAIAERRLELEQRNNTVNGGDTRTPDHEGTGEEPRTATPEKNGETAPASAPPRHGETAETTEGQSDAESEPHQPVDNAKAIAVLDGASSNAIATAKVAQEVVASADATGNTPRGVSKETLQRYRSWIAEGLRRYGSALAGLIRQEEGRGWPRRLNEAQTALLEHVVRGSAATPRTGRGRWARERLESLCNEVGVKAPGPQTLRRAPNKAKGRRAEESAETPPTVAESSEPPTAQPEPAAEARTKPVAAASNEPARKETRGCRPPAASTETTRAAAREAIPTEPEADEVAATTERQGGRESGKQDATDDVKARAAARQPTQKAPAAAGTTQQPKPKGSGAEAVPGGENEHTLRRYQQWTAEEQRRQAAGEQTAPEPVAAQPTASDGDPTTDAASSADATAKEPTGAESGKQDENGNAKAQWIFDSATPKALAAAKKAHKVVLRANASGSGSQEVGPKTLRRYRMWMAEGQEVYGSELAGLVRQRGRWTNQNALDKAQTALLQHVVRSSAAITGSQRKRQAEDRLDSLCSEVGVRPPNHKTLRQAMKKADAERAEAAAKTPRTTEGRSEPPTVRPAARSESKTKATPTRTRQRTAAETTAPTTTERAAAKAKTTVRMHEYPERAAHKAPEKRADDQAARATEVPKRPSKPALAFGPRAEPEYESVVDFRANGRNRGLLRPITAFGQGFGPRKAPPPERQVHNERYTGTKGSRLWTQPTWHRKKWTEEQWASYEEYKATSTEARSNTPTATEWQIKDERRTPKSDQEPDKTGRRTT